MLMRLDDTIASSQSFTQGPWFQDQTWEEGVGMTSLAALCSGQFLGMHLFLRLVNHFLKLGILHPQLCQLYRVQHARLSCCALRAIDCSLHH